MEKRPPSSGLFAALGGLFAELAILLGAGGLASFVWLLIALLDDDDPAGAAIALAGATVCLAVAAAGVVILLRRRKARREAPPPGIFSKGATWSRRRELAKLVGAAGGLLFALSLGIVLLLVTSEPPHDPETRVALAGALVTTVAGAGTIALAARMYFRRRPGRPEAPAISPAVETASRERFGVRARQKDQPEGPSGRGSEGLREVDG